MALAAADNYRKSRRRGQTIRKTVHVAIGTYCVINRLPLPHADQDFAPMAEHLGLCVHAAQRAQSSASRLVRKALEEAGQPTLRMVAFQCLSWFWPGSPRR